MSLTLVAAVVAAGCSGPVVGSPANLTGSASDSPGASQATAAADSSPAGPSVNGGARLTAAFKTMAAAYQFDTTVSIAGQVATHAAGRWLKGRSEFVVESGGTALTYRSIPPRSWVYQDGTDWVELADKAPSGDPLEPLRHPSAVTIVAAGADALDLQATYPPKTLGVGGSTPIAVRISISVDGRTTATYTVDTTAGPATTVTVLVSGKGLAPITAPSPAG